MEILDNRLATWLQKYLTTLHTSKYKNIRLCGSGVVKHIGATNGVYILSNGEEVKMRGLITCHNSWACPRCTPKIMSKHANNIICAQKALEKENLTSFMCTFSIPHHSYLPADLVYSALNEAWRQLNINHNKGKKQVKKYVTKLGVKTCVSKTSRYAQFTADVELKYFVKACEFTWGRNGWHPHYHIIMWIPKTNTSKVLAHEENLRQAWQKAAQCAYKKLLKKYYDQEKANNILKNLFDENSRSERERLTRGLYFSRNNKGELLIDASAKYITGWSSAQELTGQNFKKSYNGHYSPFQILQTAYEFRNCKEVYEPLMQLYLEYMDTVTKRRRINYSKGLNQIIRKYKQTTQYKEYLQKKSTPKADFVTVCWFNEFQWLLLCSYNNQLKEFILPKILELAKDFNVIAIKEFLDQFNIKTNFIRNEEAIFFENQLNAA